MDKERIVHAAENFAARAAVGVAVAGLVAGLLRVAGKAPQPSQRGGWRNLEPHEFEDTPIQSPEVTRSTL